VYCLFVSAYCTTATGCQPNSCKKYIVSYDVILDNSCTHCVNSKLSIMETVMLKLTSFTA